jgi:hypothetical protein
MNAVELQAGLARCRVAAQIIRGLEAKPSQHRAVCDVALPLPDASAPVAAPVWVQIATAGNYKGYAGGAFTFDGNVFAQIVDNFRNHPSYLKGAGGVGVADVIPWDFNHASAAFAGDGTIPVTGTPAQGWVRELDVRLGADGVPQLWAFTRWLEPARTYIIEGRYQWSSVVVGFDCRDPESGANIGAVLESVAMTNNPFIEGMQRLAATRTGAPSQQQGNTMQPVQLKLAVTPPRGGRPGVMRLASNQNDPIPDWKAPPPEQLWSTIVDRAKKANSFQEAYGAGKWLAAQPEAQQLGLDNPDRLATLVSHLLKAMAWGSKPVGTNDAPVTPIAGLSRKDAPPIPKIPKLDFTGQPGRNAVERAIRGLRASLPGFAERSWAEQCEQAGAAIRSGQVSA